MSLKLCRYIFLLPAVLLVSSCYAKPGVVVLSPEEGNEPSECVVLIHGMGRSSRAMKSMQKVLVEQGFDTVNLGYVSTKKDIETIAREDYPLAVDRCLDFKPQSIHFVTHSLGGIVLRKAFSDKKPDKLGRVVMLSPPNQGSKLVDKIKDWWLFRKFTGPAGQQLVSGEKGVPAQLGKVDFPLGIITGNSHAFFDSWFAYIIPGQDDGKVSIKSAQLEGMDDFLITGDTHPFIMNSAYVQQETVYFLRHGKFMHKQFSPEAPGGHDWDSD
ncbi:esterase/lipase family protein [Desulforhopalus sp. 52FAK]